MKMYNEMNFNHITFYLSFKMIFKSPLSLNLKHLFVFITNQVFTFVPINNTYFKCIMNQM